MTSREAASRNATFLVAIGLCLGAFVQSGGLAAASPARQGRPRIILFKVDGLSGLLMEAALAPESEAVWRLPFPNRFREDYHESLALLNRQELLPNMTEYFVRQGVRAEAIFTGTLPLSAPSWAQIDSGQPSIIKSNFYFNRASGESKVYLNGLLDSAGKLIKGSGRTHALWQLDLLGIPILADAFPPERVWSSLQTLSRKRSAIQLGAMGKYLVRAGEREFKPGAVIHQHLTHLVVYPDHVERLDESLARTLAKWLKWKAEGDLAETLDFATALFVSLDHRLHLDGSYKAVLNLLVKIDDWFGEVMGAVEQTVRRDQTMVVLTSDHGMNLYPVQTNYGFPINPWLRRPEFGGHTVLSPEVEDSDHALTQPIPGVDFARVYESSSSPYGQGVPFGSKGYFTAFAANMGNPRFDLFLRNSDLNQIHLLLLDSLRFRSQPEKLRRVFKFFGKVFQEARAWLDREAEAMGQAAEEFQNWSRQHLGAGDASAMDAASRLASEAQHYRVQSAALRRLLAVPLEEEEWLDFVKSDIDVTDLVPKGYFGPPNSLEQLTRYTVGWAKRSEERWLRPDPAPFRTLDYPELFASYRALNPDGFGNHYPFQYVVASIPIGELAGAEGPSLSQSVWLLASGDRSQAVLLEGQEGSIWYSPIEALKKVEGLYRLRLAKGQDPLGYPQELWASWLDPRSWVLGTSRHKNSQAPVILTDLFRRNFESHLNGLESSWIRPADRRGWEKRVRALRFRFDQGTPDFRVWMRQGWNVNTKGQQPGGSHGGFRPLETQTTFMVWGGNDLGLRRGERFSGAFLTLDIMPTLLDAIGRLDCGSARMLPDPNTARSFPPFPGRVMPIRRDSSEKGE